VPEAEVLVPEAELLVPEPEVLVPTVPAVAFLGSVPLPAASPQPTVTATTARYRRPNTVL